MSAYPAMRIVRALTPWFWAHASAPAHILIHALSVVEIDNAVYMSIVILFTLFFVLNLIVTSWVSRRYEGFAQIVRLVSYTCVIYLLFVSGKSLFELDLVTPKLMIIALIIGALLTYISDSNTLMKGIFGVAILRLGITPLILYDIGANPLVFAFDYLIIGSALTTMGYIYSVAQYVPGLYRILEILVSRFTMRRIIVLLIGAVWISLLYQFTLKHGAVDIYYVLMPAYHFLHGGTPLVSMMSQYGLLYLAPWVLWLLLLPAVPVSYLAGTMLSTLLLLVYYGVLIIVSSKFYKRRIVFVLTMLSAYYFTIIIRYWGFVDRVSLVASPSFTPIRFGVFIVPLVCLYAYTRGKGRQYFSYFLIISSLSFFYSFEIGAGILAAGVLVAMLDVVMHAHAGVKTALHHGAILIGTVIATGGLLSLFFLLRSGQFPDWGSYAYFSKMFGLGYLMLPLGNQTVVFLPVGMALFGCLFGLWRLFGKKKTDGYIFIYLGFTTLSIMPYYMGRSIYQTLYNVSLPFILLSGFFLEYGLKHIRKQITNLSLWVMTAMCGFILVVPSMRAVPILGNSVIHTAEIVDNAARYVKRYGSTWDILENSSYIFLKHHLPEGCPLISFDAQEYELLTALRATPAYNYGYVWGFIVSSEQVDQLKPVRGSSRICVFINDVYLDTHEDIVSPVFGYYWARYGKSARLLSEDPALRVRLYELPVK